jgi:hypothetical protein
MDDVIQVFYTEAIDAKLQLCQCPATPSYRGEYVDVMLLFNKAGCANFQDQHHVA